MKKKIENKIYKILKNFKFNKQKFIPGKTSIPVTGKVIDKSEVTHIIKSAFDGWLTAGRFNSVFEKKLANYIDIKNFARNCIKKIVITFKYKLIYHISEVKLFYLLMPSPKTN